MTGDADYKGNQFIYEKDPFTEGGTHYEVYKLLYDLEADGFTEGIENNISWQTTWQRFEQWPLCLHCHGLMGTAPAKGRGKK